MYGLQLIDTPESFLKNLLLNLLNRIMIALNDPQSRLST